MMSAAWAKPDRPTAAAARMRSLRMRCPLKVASAAALLEHRLYDSWMTHRHESEPAVVTNR
ncbi:hypothetical protein BOS5A_110246 [Bosea sp. EC-HK365B]|nr:hypothetical protein BOSE21B_50205 [Bosea sp. 21B]VVT51177.1 hypothetical protein BOS5A_110246 [Bosea sp. EC-HK365B]